MARQKHPNEVKRSRYEQYAEQRKKALRSECYFECMLIDYAMIEDRLLAILARAGFVQRRDETNPSWGSRNRDERRALLATVDSDFANKPPRIKSISTKVMTLRALCSVDFGDIGFDSVYARWLDGDVHRVLEDCAVADLCDRIDSWRERRNVYVHALFGSASYGSEKEGLRAFVEEGRELALELNRVSSRMRTAEKHYEKLKAAAYRANTAGKKRGSR